MKKKKKEEKEDFLAVIKLVSGEEIISTITLLRVKRHISYYCYSSFYIVSLEKHGHQIL